MENREADVAFGDLLRSYRGAAGRTEEELAEGSGITAQVIGLLECGRFVLAGFDY